MTLCIAAKCQLEDGSPRIVVCTDTKVSTPIASSETQTKLRFFRRAPFAAAFSGDISAALELLSIYEDLPVDKALTLNELEEQFRAPIKHRKDQMREHVAQCRTGLTCSEFLDRRVQMGVLGTSVFERIDELTLEVDLLIAGFHADQSHIFEEVLEDIRYHEHFACIGDGNQAAEQSLHRREQTRTESLIHTLYHVYEAKRLGEGAPSVGRMSVMYVLAPPVRGNVLAPEMRFVNHEGIRFLEKCFGKYGPRPVKGLALPEDSDFFWAPETVAPLIQQMNAEGAGAAGAGLRGKRKRNEKKAGAP